MIRRHLHARDFLAHTRELLEQDEALNNLMLGLAQMFSQSDKDLSEKVLMYDYSEDDVPVFCTLQTPPREIILYGHPNAWERWVPIVAANMKGMHPDIPGVNAPKEIAHAFARAWTGGDDYVVKYEQGVYRLDKLIPPRPSGGHLRLATMDDQELLAVWYQKFSREAVGQEYDLDSQRKVVERQIGRGWLYVWEDEKPVSMAAITRKTRHGASIAYVYTPPELRGKGYGSNVTAGVTQAALDDGADFCSLYTDLANGTSNHIYQAIGYAYVAPCSFIRWEEDE